MTMLTITDDDRAEAEAILHTWLTHYQRADEAGDLREIVARLVAERRTAWGESESTAARHHVSRIYPCEICGGMTEWYSSNPAEAPCFHMRNGDWRPFHMTCVGRAITAAILARAESPR